MTAQIPACLCAGDRLPGHDMCIKCELKHNIGDDLHNLLTEKQKKFVEDVSYSLGSLKPDENDGSYCPVFGGCGYLGCDGVKDFLEKHVRGKTDCTQEAIFIQEIIDMWDYSDL